MKKRFISFILAFCMVAALLTTAALAADVKYKVTGGYIYFNAETGAITDCDANVTAANIPDTISGVKVTSIGEFAFEDCVKLTSVSIPDGVKSIEACAFRGCSSLKDLSIPNSVTSIGGAAFAGCPALKEVTFFGSEAQWNAIAFAYPKSLQNVDIWFKYKQEKPYAKGDVNGDDAISNSDLVKLARAIVGLETLTANQTAAADLNGDGNVSNSDLVALARRLVGLDDII